jgi:anti-anti-sigma regulatory factor
MSSDYHHIRFEGFLDIGRYPEFRQAFEGLPSTLPVLCDLTGAATVDSVFLSELMLARRRHDAPFAILIAPSTAVARVFGIATFDQRPYVFQDLPTALAWLGSAPRNDPS